MEETLIQKMKENFGYFGGMSLLYGIIFAACLYKNAMGAASVLCIGTTIFFSILFLKRIGYRVKKYTIQYFAGMLLLGLSSCLTTSLFFVFFNWIGILLLFAIAMLHQFYEDEAWDFPAYILRLLVLFGTTVVAVGYPIKHGSAYAALQKETQKKTLTAVFAGLILAVAFMIVVLPLLLKSDMVFANYFSRFFVGIPLPTILGWVVMMIVGTCLCYAFFGALCRKNCPALKVRNPNTTNPVIGITFISVLVFVYVIYCGIQIVYLFLGMESGLPEGITYAAYAHAGFWQLLAVSFINFVTVLICMNRFREHRVLKVLLTMLSACTFIMTGSAAYRMILYVAKYRLTFLRILVLWFLFVLACIMLGVVISIYSKRLRLFPYIVMVVTCGYILLSFLRVDHLTAEYNVSRSDKILASDVRYLMSGSMDAAPIIADISAEDIDSSGEGGTAPIELEMRAYMNQVISNTQEETPLKANYGKLRARRAAEKYLEAHPLW